MGFQGSQYLVVKHTDTPHDHIHLVASRIRMTDGSVVSESRDYQRSEGVLRGIEKDYGLTRVTPSREVEHRAPSHGELELARKGIPSTRLRLQGLVDGAIHDRPTMTTFLGRMEASQVSVIPNQAKAGHISGVTFLLEGEPMKGSDLGRGYTWAGLQKRGVSYEHDRDGQAVSQAKERGERAWAHTRGGTNGERRVSGQRVIQEVSRQFAPLSEAIALQSRDLRESMAEFKHMTKRFHEEFRGAIERARRAGAELQEPKPADHVQTMGDHVGHQPPHRSAERIRVLKNAAESLRRQGRGHVLAKSSRSVSEAQPGPAAQSQPAPRFKSKALEHLENEIAALEHQEREEERERQRKLQKERELGQKMDRSRGMGFSR